MSADFSRFSKEQTQFPSSVHQIIYSTARQLTPLELSLGWTEDEELKASCKDYHAFMLALLSDMYENPEAYGLPVMLLENHLDGKKLNGVKRKQPAKTEKILSQTHNCVNGYQLLLCMLGREGIFEDNALTVSDETLAIIAKKTSTSTSPIPLSTRLEGLARVGFIKEGNRFVSTRYPQMLKALCALASSSEKLSSFGYFAFQNLEFRQLHSKYKPTYEDYAQPLINERRSLSDVIDAYARSLKAKSACNTFWKVDYKYKGNQVMCLDTAKGDLTLRITATYSWDDPALINGRLEKESPAFQKDILRHLWGCTGCSTSHLGVFATVLGRRRRVCMGGGIGFRWINPTQEDLDVIKRCLELRCRIIDEKSA